jgi:hypothetical protein
MVELTDDQKVQLDVELIRLIAQGVITDGQREEIMQAVLGIVMTPEEMEYERRNTQPRNQDEDTRRAASA